MCLRVKDQVTTMFLCVRDCVTAVCKCVGDRCVSLVHGLRHLTHVTLAVVIITNMLDNLLVTAVGE